MTSSSAGLPAPEGAGSVCAAPNLPAGFGGTFQIPDCSVAADAFGGDVTGPGDEQRFVTAHAYLPNAEAAAADAGACDENTHKIAIQPARGRSMS